MDATKALRIAVSLPVFALGSYAMLVVLLLGYDTVITAGLVTILVLCIALFFFAPSALVRVMLGLSSGLALALVIGFRMVTLGADNVPPTEPGGVAMFSAMIGIAFAMLAALSGAIFPTLRARRQADSAATIPSTARTPL